MIKDLSNTLTLMGIVKSVDASDPAKTGSFTLKLRSGDEITIYVTDNTNYTVLQNLDNLNRDRVLDPEGSLNENVPDVLWKIRKYVYPDGMLAVQCISYQQDARYWRQATQVTLLHSTHGRYLFEDTHWWLTQITVMANQWLDELFGDKRTYLLDDFVGLYRTNLNYVGLPTGDPMQEMATLSRYIYGLASSYLLTGSQRYLDAAKAGVKFQRDAFRILTHDGQYCFWAFGRRKLNIGSETIEYSLNPDDFGAIPLYEQIYGLAGLTQYYRITGDLEVLEDIRRTVYTFNAFYSDNKELNPYFPDNGFPGKRGYFSHLDYVTRRPDEKSLDRGGTNNRSKKNWNSVGDHIPAYLINLILILDPPPQGHAISQDILQLVDICKKMLRECSELILEHFPDPDKTIPFVRERFDAEWNPDLTWGWQQNRAIVGHNLKIAWNLTRVANYYLGDGNDKAFAERLMERANVLGQTMGDLGVDQLRGGCFDAVERKPSNGMPLEFVWGNTKDFWQQEQGILAYLVLHGATTEPELKKHYLQLAREMSAFWNLYFLDHDNRGVFFRVSADGQPIILGGYANKAGHAIAGYHSYELNFLAHLYIRSFVHTPTESDTNFVLYFKPDDTCRSLNVLPDFFAPDTLKLVSIKVNGIRRAVEPNNFQILVDETDKGAIIAVEFKPTNV